MKRLLLLLCFAFIIPLAGLSPQYNHVIYISASNPVRPYDRIWEAVCYVESRNNPMAYNRVEKAVGISQIRYIRLKDYNKRTGKDYKLKDCFDVKVSKEIFFYYVTQFEPDDIIGIAQNWNGRGKKHKDYAKKIKKYLQMSNI